MTFQSSWVVIGTVRTVLNPLESIRTSVICKNKRHSELVSNLFDDQSLADPYRVKFPNKQEYTFVPSDPIQKKDPD